MVPLLLTLVIFTLIALIIQRFFPDEQQRPYILLALNSGFIYSSAPGILSLLPFLVFLTLGYIALKTMERSNRDATAATLVVFIVLFFVYLKHYVFIAFVPAIPYLYSTIGLSYVLFRIIHMCMDLHEGAIKNKITVLAYLNYTCLFLTFLSGPIQRYQDHLAQMGRSEKKNLSKGDIAGAGARMLKGFFKVIAVGAAVWYLHTHLLEAAHAKAMTELLFIMISFFYFLYVYVNFSGYMDIVVSLGELIGFHLPENFDEPYKARNMFDFFSRWHMTLTGWLKTYVFNPMMKALLARQPDGRLLTVFGVFAYFVTFFLMGLWHNSSWLGLVYGLCLGLGVSGNKVYELIVRRFLDKKTVMTLHDNYFFAHFSTGVTLSVISLTLCTLWTDAQGCRAIYSDLGMIGIMGAFLMSSVMFMLLKMAGELIAGFWGQVSQALKDQKDVLLVGRIFLLCFELICVIFTVMISSGDVPKLVYQAF